jgi:cysteinyl-tRNA synthetase
MMKLHNTLTRKTEEFKPLHDKTVRMYSCGPTIYDHAHIGNLSSYIYADTLRRTLQSIGHEVRHVMNLTDIEDKIIRRSQERYPDMSPEEAMHKLTDEYGQLFFDDMAAIGNDTEAMEFVWATKSIEGMRALITDLYQDGFAYIADGSVYFSIEKYKASGKTYGQLLKLDADNTSAARIDNDEYDKESVHDFALWKGMKPNEPAWEFELDGQDVTGRPGWHIECSMMSVNALGMPFDIHTGGVDLIFPHHENEIAQSTAGKGSVFSTMFVHNEHILVDGKKMSKSLGNFHTLTDIRERGFEPLAFRLMVLQSHYRNQSNFTWENLEAAQNRLNNYRAMADLKWQVQGDAEQWIGSSTNIKSALQAIQDDLNTPSALSAISRFSSHAEERLVNPAELDRFNEALQIIDMLFGLDLGDRADILPEQKQLLGDRQKARDAKDWSTSDEIRDHLKQQGIAVRDTAHGQIWHRL